jgi:5-methylcytosine-specific restriction endonuclease McrA
MKDCLSTPIPEIEQAALYLLEAEVAHEAGRHEEASRLLKKADDPLIFDWVNSVMGKFNPSIHVFHPQNGALPYLTTADRPKPRMPGASVRRAAIARDGYHCRFCGMPVVSTNRRQTIVRLYPSELRWGSSNTSIHAAFWCMWLQFDGGTSVLDNVVVTCAPCNFGRNSWTLEEAGLNDPRLRPRFSLWSSLKSWNDLACFG